MIDFHSHILPDMDDGSESAGESLQMLRLSFNMGIDTVVLTPHYYPQFEAIPSFLDRRHKKKEVLAQRLRGISDIPSIVMGTETAFFPGMSRERALHGLCISDTKYMLVELPFYDWTSQTFDELDNLLSVRGIIPIIAHIDRYLYHWKNKRKIDTLIGMGAIIQLNAESLIGNKDQKSILRLLSEGKIHLLGSDCHNMYDRKPNLSHALRVIEKEIGYSCLKRIDLNGRAILNNNLLD